MKNAIIIFVRNPELGKAKTRLAATVGDEKALEIYKELLQHTFNITAAVEADKYVFYHEAINETDVWNAVGFYKELQNGDVLGEKMDYAFTAVFNRPYHKVIIIGSDCLQLSSAIINDAFAALQNHDTVIGPAKDGGYYLLGMKKLVSGVFENKKWSTDSVYADTLNTLQTNGLTTALLPQLTDVDTEDDWLESKS